VATNFQIPFNLSEKALKQWLNSLENNQDSEKAHQIFLAIQAINNDLELSLTKKNILLQSIYKKIPDILDSLKKTILKSTLPLSSKEQNSIQHIVWIYAELANGLESCISNKSSQANAQTIYYGLRSIMTAYIHISEVYQQPYANFWKQSYYFYGTACKLEILELNIKQEGFHNDTINNAFKLILALYHCGLEQFRPRDIVMIANCMEKYTSPMLLKKTFDNTKASRYSGIDLNTDNPPSALTRLTKTGKSSLRFFSAYISATQLYKNADEEAVGTGVLRNINHEIIRQVAKTLSLSQKRLFTRFDEQKIINAIVGLQNIIDELAKSSTITIATKQTVAKTSRNWKADELELVPTGFESLDAVKNNVIQGHFTTKKQKQINQEKKLFNANDKAYSHDNDIWSDISTLSQQDFTPDYNLELGIYDSSISGYKVIFDTYKNTSRVQIGDIIGIKKNDAIEIGIICRILQLTDNKLQLGIKLLALEAEMAYINLSSNDSINTRALFLPAIKELNPASTLLFNDTRFQSKDTITLYLTNEKKFSCCLSKPLHISYAATHYETVQLKPC